MTSDTGAVARIVDGLREIADEADVIAAVYMLRSDDAGRLAAQLQSMVRRCLAVAEAQR